MFYIEIWRRGRDSNPRWGLAHTRFPGVRLKPLIHLSEALDYSHRKRAIRRSAQFGAKNARFVDQTTFCVCTIFIAEPMSAETSVMLLGTMSVVFESEATWL